VGSMHGRSPQILRFLGTEMKSNLSLSGPTWRSLKDRRNLALG
jgi:hypothetical protein